MRGHVRRFAAIAAILVSWPPAFAFAQQAPRAVLVTGASSGLGRAITERLAASGFFVYAGGRTPAELADLNTIKNVQAVRLDVTSPSDIAASVETVTKAGRGLYAVVNNAGILVIAPLIEATDAQVNDMFNVNVFGAYRVTKAFAPLLIESKGRVVNISSLNGIVSQPTIGLYSMTKHAIEAYSESLGAEMRPLGVSVAAIEPGNYRSNLIRSAIARVDTAALTTSRFAAAYRSMLNATATSDRDPPPTDVANTVFDALTTARVRQHYLITPNAGQARFTLQSMINELAQLNESQPVPFARDSLVKLLDDALARAKTPE